MWLHVPSAFLPDAERLTSPSDLLCQILEQSATWRGSCLPPASWRRVLRKDLSTTPLFGLTSEPSTLARGVEAWIASLADSLARTSPSPVAVKELSKETEAGYGSNLPASFARFDPDSLSWKTSAQSLFEDSIPFSGTWPRSGSMRSGCAYERRTWAPRTGASGGSVSQWPTTSAGDGERGSNSLYIHGDRKAGRMLSQEANRWPTPDANSASYSNGVYGPNLREASMEFLPSAQWRNPSAGHPAKGGSQDPEKRLAGGHTLDLQDQAEYWSTPNVPNGGRTLSDEDILNRGQTAKGKRQVGLENEAKIWPTPQSRDWKSGEASEETAEKNARPLNEIAETWPTPSASMATMEDMEQARYSGKDPRRPKYSQSLPQDQTTPDGPLCWCGIHGCALPSHKRRLNPLFVSFLMGLPPFWLLPAPMPFGPAEIASYRFRQRQVLESF